MQPATANGSVCRAASTAVLGSGRKISPVNISFGPRKRRAGGCVGRSRHPPAAMVHIAVRHPASQHSHLAKEGPATNSPGQSLHLVLPGKSVVIPKFSWLGHVVSASRGSEGGRRLECLINILSRSRVIELSGDGLVLNQIFQLRLLKSFSYKYPRCISRPRGGSLHSHNLICGSGSSAKKCIWAGSFSAWKPPWPPPTLQSLHLAPACWGGASFSSLLWARHLWWAMRAPSPHGMWPPVQVCLEGCQEPLWLIAVLA